MTPTDSETTTLKRQIGRLLDQALAGQLKIEQLHESWPQAANAHQFFLDVFEDLEVAVEHTPGRLFSSQVDLKAWRGTEEYLDLYIDSLLLDHPLSLADLASWHREIRELGPGSEREIEEAVAAVSKSHSSVARGT